MSDTQAKTIRDLLLAAIASYDPNIDLTVGGRAYSRIISPIYDALTPDLFDTDLDAYLLSVLKEEYPTLELQEGDLIVDLLIKPLRLILEPLKREINLLKKRQSIAYASQLTTQDAEDLAANFFVTRQAGSRARGIVRVMLTTPTFLTITDKVRFSTSNGLRFYPLRQEFISVETVALQQIGNLYYVDITVVAELEGTEYNLDAGAISVVEGIPNYVSVTNPFSFEQGVHSETKEELLARTELSLTERSLTSRRGIRARVRDEFADIRSVSITGYGDPEMERDVLTGTGDGSLIASGISFIVGRYLFMITGFEDTTDGERLPSPGDQIKLNFWKFMYTTSSVETNEIAQVIYTSYGDAPDLPSVHILLLKEDITRTPLTGGYLPGVYLGVFSAIFSEPSLTISGIPGGIEDVNNLLPIGVKSNEVHIGGKYDIWVRPSSIDDNTSNISILKSAYIDKDETVFFDGNDLSTLLSGKYPLNRAGLPYALEVPSNSLYVREPIIGLTSQSLGFISKVVGSVMYITGRSGSFTANETIKGLYSNNTTTIQNIVYTEAGSTHIGSVLTTTDPEGSYFIVDVYENYYILSSEESATLNDVPAYIHKTTGVQDLFDPVFKVYPEKADYSTKLQTFIGKSSVEISHNIIAEGVVVGDTLEILSGEDVGRFGISEVVLSSTNYTELVLDASLSRTNSNVRFRIIREEAAIAAPLIRIKPSGITQSTGVGAGYEIPYKHPVGAYALGAFSGSIGKYDGLNGFVLPNMGEQFKGSGAGVGDLALTADPTFLATFSNAKVDDCISEGCTDCTGIPITCTVTIDGSATNYSSVHFYITGLLSSTGKSYLTDFKAWLTSIIDAFFRGQNSQNQALADDLNSFVDQFAPITFGEPPSQGTENIIKQFELCIPSELFDGCNNTYMAIPEFIWDSEFESVDTFTKAITEFLAGRMRANPTSLKYAKAGDSLKIRDGANQGEYVIDKVVNIPWYHGDTIATETTIDENGTSTTTNTIVDNKAYDFTLVFIRGEFPNESLKDSSSYFGQALPQVSSLLPTVPVSTLNSIHTLDIATGALQNPFDVIQEAYTILFQTMYAQGFDLPETFDLQPGPVLTKITKSFFSAYTIGNRSPQQTTRILFQDPVDTTVYSAIKCGSVSWKEEVKTGASIEADIAVSLPISTLGSSAMTVYTSINSSQDYELLTGTISTAANTEADIEVLVEYIQAALDPSRSKVRITYQTIGSTYKLKIGLLAGGKGSYIKADVSSELQTLGFTTETINEGVSSVASTTTTVKTKSNNGTRFSLTQGVVERQLILDIQENEDFYASLLPRKSANMLLADTELPRDSVFSAHYLLAESCTTFFTDKNGDSAIEAGIRAGDLFYLYEQVCTLDNTGVVTNPFKTKKDRILHVRYNSSLKSVSLLNTAGTFLTPESTNAVGESPEEDVVQVGDLIYFEDSDSVARVATVKETTLVLQEDVSVGAQPTAIQSGYDGSVSGTEFTTSTSYSFTASDIGNYLVIYGSENTGVDGTYSIDSVTAGAATLSETFAIAESDLHWLMVKPTFDEIGSSNIDGFSATIGVTPVRIYRGVPKSFTVGSINTFLKRERSEIEILYGDIDGGPRRGVRQPFKVVRPSEYRISANQMKEQGTKSGLYYFDVPTTTLTPTFDLNIPENTQYTPIVNTMLTKGYSLNVANRSHVFSGREKCSLLIDSSYIPSSLNGAVSNTQSPEKATITLSYESSSVAGSLQAFLESDANRNLCADPLVKHYLPSYVMVEITGGSVNGDAVDLIVEYINELSPTDSIRLSDLEKRLHQANIDRYNHPIFIHCLTHDLNRNIILTRTDNLVDDTTILHEGTNRITYFIANPDYITVGESI